MAKRSPEQQARTRYDQAVARRGRILRAWREAGYPLTAEGSQGQLVEHVLVKMLRDHDRLLEQISAGMRGKHAGPKASAVVTPSIGRSPAAKLREVK